MAEMAATIREADPNHPVLIGLHAASLHADVGLRMDHAAATTDISVMHGYSIYDPLARAPLDPELVPFTAALTAALAGRPVLFEEFGVNTMWPDGPSHWEDLPTWDGGTRRAYFAIEEDAAAYYAAVLERLHRGGCLGAFAWCFGDYAPQPLGSAAVRPPEARALLRPLSGRWIPQADGSRPPRLRRRSTDDPRAPSGTSSCG